MANIKDFNCEYGSAGISKGVSDIAGVELPEGHLHAESIVKLSRALKQHDGAAFCELPFCHTLEADAYGANINLGDYNTGPRAKEYITTKVEDVLNLPDLDFSKGRICEVLKAARTLVDEGEYVILETTGPITILNMMIDPKYVFKTFRRKPEVMQQVFDKLADNTIRFMEEAKAAGVQMISFADVVGGVDILGPAMAEQMVEMFTYPFFKRAEALADDHTMIMTCPKSSFALLGCDKAEWRDVPLSGPLRYGEACIEMIGKVKIAGMQCFKNINYTVDNSTFKELVLL